MVTFRNFVRIYLPAACQSQAASSAGGESMTIQMQLGQKTFSVSLAETAAAQAFAKRLPVSLHMQELNGSEKYAYLQKALPADPQPVGQIHAGDILVFGKDCLVLFYESFQTPYRYTRIGRVKEASLLPDLSNNQTVAVTFRH